MEAIRDWPRPLTKKQVRTFEGLTSYYRRFIPNYASIARPLTALIQNSQPTQVKWTEETEKAFRCLVLGTHAGDSGLFQTTGGTD